MKEMLINKQEIGTITILKNEIQKLKDLLKEKNDYIKKLEKYISPKQFKVPQTTQLTILEKKILLFLWKKDGDFVDEELIYINLYANDKQNPTGNIIGILISKLKKNIKPYKIKILFDKDKGYRLESDSLEIIRKWQFEED